MRQVRQTTSHVLMIRPAQFGFNEQTAGNNAFQQNSDRYGLSEIKNLAIQEFDAFVTKLRSKGITVNVVDDTAQPVKPDAVFPNNWISFHHDGNVITYPMYAPVRRQERRQDIIDQLAEKYVINGQVKFEHYETQNEFLEGTGSMILDRINRIVYACTSPRTHRDILEEFCKAENYSCCVFKSVDQKGMDIYHTNVMMALGENFVVICMDSVQDQKEHQMLREVFAKTKKEIIEISYDQMLSFAGNMLQLRNDDDETFLVMSEQAFQSLSESQIKQIEKYTEILHSPITVIETYGGGSARCMIAEVFLPPK